MFRTAILELSNLCQNNDFDKQTTKKSPYLYSVTYMNNAVCYFTFSHSSYTSILLLLLCFIVLLCFGCC